MNTSPTSLPDHDHDDDDDDYGDVGAGMGDIPRSYSIEHIKKWIDDNMGTDEHEFNEHILNDGIISQINEMNEEETSSEIQKIIRKYEKIFGNTKSPRTLEQEFIEQYGRELKLLYTLLDNYDDIYNHTNETGMGEEYTIYGQVLIGNFKIISHNYPKLFQ